MKVRLMITGGTIDKFYNQSNGELEFDKTHFPEMIKRARIEVDLITEELLLIDSLDMVDSDRQLILENCEKCYSSEDCLQISEKLNIPHIYDVHHYNCYSLLHPQEKQTDPVELMPKIINTWKRRNLKPYFHISEQGSGRIGHHSDYIETIPDYILDIGVPITMDVEAKAKEQAILRLMRKYDL